MDYFLSINIGRYLVPKLQIPSITSSITSSITLSLALWQLSGLPGPLRTLEYLGPTVGYAV